MAGLGLLPVVADATCTKTNAEVARATIAPVTNTTANATIYLRHPNSRSEAVFSATSSNTNVITSAIAASHTRTKATVTGDAATCPTSGTIGVVQTFTTDQAMTRSRLAATAVGLLLLFQVEVASACLANAMVARVELRNGGTVARVYVAPFMDPFGFLGDGPADVYFPDDKYRADLSDADGGVLRLGHFFETDAPSCPASGSAGILTYAETHGVMPQ